MSEGNGSSGRPVGLARPGPLDRSARIQTRITTASLDGLAAFDDLAAPHRAASYEASRFVIEEVKTRLPVWKHERYVGGDAAWVGAP